MAGAELSLVECENFLEPLAAVRNNMEVVDRRVERGKDCGALECHC
jgi:hypothetical protein